MSQQIAQKEEVLLETIQDTTVQESSNDNSFESLEIFYEKNKKAITYGGGALIAIIALFLLYKYYWLPGQEKEASNEAFFAQNYFEKDSFNIALNGGVNVQTADGPKTMLGFKDIADSYSSTKTGNVANYYAGICLLRSGKFAEAIESLEKFDGNDEVLAPVALGAIGDANMELNNVDDALKFYLKAADKSTNAFTTPIFLKKAAFAYEQKANYTDALSTYERLKNEFPKSSEARDADKYIARVNLLSGVTTTLQGVAGQVESLPVATTEGALDVNGNFIYNTGAETVINLAGGQILTVGANSTEAKLYNFLSDNTLQVDTVDKTQGWLALDRVYFENGKSVLTAESELQLQNISKILSAYPTVKLKLGGYTDNTGSEIGNIKISGDRAATALKTIIKNGVDAKRLKSEGYGPQHPIASNDTPEGKAQNRRVDIRVTKK